MNRILWTVATVVGVFLIACAKVDNVDRSGEVSQELMIADFNAGQEPNLLGGDFGAWDRDPDDDTQGAETFFDENVTIDGSMYSLGIEYDVDSPEPAFNGFWMKLEGADFSEYDKLHFSVKGSTEAGFTKRFKMELRSADGQTGSCMFSGVTGQWKEVQVPLKSFRGLRDLSEMDELVIVFEDNISSPKEGIIYFDNIYVK